MPGWLVRPHLTLFSGIFCVMALSNAIVPVLPSYGSDSSINGLIYAAYFLGAFVITLPSGMLADRHGPLPLIRAGLAITVISGLSLALVTEQLLVTILRFIEGLGAGFFVAAAMSWVNSSPDHVRMSGWLMASMNAGLVLGLLVSGWIGAVLHASAGGILLFALMAAIPALFSLRLRLVVSPPSRGHGLVIHFVRQYGWLFYSAVILIGITGVITSLYPHHSQAPSDILGIWIAAWHCNDRSRHHLLADDIRHLQYGCRQP
jgi:MFS family permease